MKNKAKQSLGWAAIMALAFIIFWLSITGRMGILASIAVYPDQVAYTGS